LFGDAVFHVQSFHMQATQFKSLLDVLSFFFFFFLYLF
jgi:hypothetical protein